MKKAKQFILSSLLLILSLSNTNSSINVNAAANNMKAPQQTYLKENDNVEAFYTESSAGSVKGLQDDALLEQLAKIMSVKHRYYTSYDEVRGANAFSDECLDDPTKVIAFYGGIPISNKWQPTNYNDVEAWNREHVWCKSLSGGLYTSVSGSNRNAGTDIHQLKPSVQSLNSTRNNLMYGDLNKSGTQLIYNHTWGQIKTGNYYNSKVFEPRDGIKGDVARILMYMYTHYSNEVDNSTANKNGSLKIENIFYTPFNDAKNAWNILLKWNEFDPVDEFESNRNNYCASITGVRNPFIDHPEFANMIWDENYNGNGALEDNGPVVTDGYINLLNNQMDLLINETYQIVPSSNIENSQFTYTSNNTNIATVTKDGIVKAISEGVTQIIVKNGNVQTLFTVNVIKAKPTSSSWDLVTNVNQLELNKSYIIAATDSSIAMSKEQKTNNRGQIEIEKIGKHANINENVEVFTLKEGVTNSSYGLLSSSGYLYAAGGTSTSNNYLKTKQELDQSASFSINISNDGKAEIKTIDETIVKNTIKYNQTSSLFSCYSANQKDICLYKLNEVTVLDLTTEVSLEYDDVYKEVNQSTYEFYKVSNFSLNINAKLKTANSNLEYGYILTLKSNLSNTLITSLYKESDDDLDKLCQKINGEHNELIVNDGRISFIINNNLNKEHAFIFYCYDKENNIMYFSKQYSILFMNVVDAYLTNDYLLETLGNKEQVINSLLKIKESV